MTESSVAEVGPQDRVQSYLERRGLDTRGARAVPLTGDASDRRYFRILVPHASSAVLAVHAEPIDYATLPFVRVAELLGRMRIPVPAIHDHVDELGILALDDLGDVTLQAHLGTCSAAEHVELYRQAIDLIVTMQQRGPELASPRYPPFHVAFDEEKLSWEMEFFVKHFLEAYRGVHFSPAHRVALQEQLRALIEPLAAERRVLCHRDYHSRNLMLHKGKLHLIDFQDARMGPDTYDVASLLRDSYADLGEAVVTEMLGYFLELKGTPEQAVDFRERFDLMALQRNLKALGTFGYQTTARGNPVYIQYIPRTIRYVRDTLARYPALSELRLLLGSLMEELEEMPEPRVAADDSR